MNAPFSIWSQYYNTEEPETAILEFEKDGVTVLVETKQDYDNLNLRNV